MLAPTVYFLSPHVMKRNKWFILGEIVTSILNADVITQKVMTLLLNPEIYVFVNHQQKIARAI